MRKIDLKIVVSGLVLVLVMGCSGQGLDLSSAGEMFQMNKPVVVEPSDFETLPPELVQAFVAAEAAKTRSLKSLPYALVDANSKLEVDEIPKRTMFRPVSLLLTDYKQGSHLSYLSEAADRYGRIDRRMGSIDYELIEPNAGRAQAIKSWLMQQGKAVPEKEQADSQRNLSEFQQEQGLNPNGQLDSRTATALGKNLSVLKVKKLQNQIFYPETPNHMSFVLPYEVFKKNKNKLSLDFKSLEAVSALGLTPEQFKDRVKPGQEYVVFVFFFDRVDPEVGISLGFTVEDAHFSVTGASESRYAKQGTWPVIAERFVIDDNLAESLYMHVFMKKGLFDFHCAGAHKFL